MSNMEIEDDDDFYGEEPKAPVEEKQHLPADDLEEGEEEDEGAAMDEDDDDSDSVRNPLFDVVAIPNHSAGYRNRHRTQRRHKSCPSTVSHESSATKSKRLIENRQTKYSDIRNIPTRSTSSEVATKPASAKADGEPKSQSAANIAAPSADKTSAAASKSTIDIHADPIHPVAGKPITQVNIDEGKLLRVSCDKAMLTKQTCPTTKSLGGNRGRILAIISTTVSMSLRGHSTPRSRSLSAASSPRTSSP